MISTINNPNLIIKDYDNKKYNDSSELKRKIFQNEEIEDNIILNNNISKIIKKQD